MITRRHILAMAGSVPGLLSSAASAYQSTTGPRMGGAPTAFSLRMRAARKNGQRFDMVEHCHSVGLAGAQATPSSIEPDEIRKFRERVEAYQMHLICDPRLPRDESGLAEFEAQVKAYKEAGAVAFHAALTGRRYEDFDSLEPFKQMFEGRKRQVEMVEPVLAKYKVPLGIENHKGWRSAEQAAWLKGLGSEWVGVCLDFGNNLSLCEDPMDTARTLTPYTVFAHIKDMGVQDYEDGFLLSEVPMGEGIVDLKGIVGMLRQKDPKMIFDLEMITRDPLKIPVFTTKYWATFDDSYSPLSGRDLAKVLNLVRKNPPKQPLPHIAGLSAEAAVKAEDDYNLQCIAYAHANLDL